MSTLRRLVLLVMGAGLVTIGPYIASTRAAPGRESIQYQGRLVDANGVPLEGTISRLSFRLYSTAAPSSASFVWGEVHEDVPVSRGVFTVLLGAGSKRLDAAGVETPGRNAFSTEFDGGAPRFVQVQVDGDAPLSPLSPLASVPYAMSAGGSVPVGTVLPWWPPAPGAAVPDGFELCDGTPVVTPGPLHGFAKPDLMGSPRFIRGLSLAALPGFGGGSSFVTGGVDATPAHTHDGSRPHGHE